MEPVHVLPDVTKVVLGYGRPLVADRPEPVCVGVTMGRTVKPSKKPCVQVRAGTGSQITPAHDRVLVDFLIWHRTPDEAMELARILRALYRAAAGDPTPDGRITFSDELMRPTDTIDPLDGDTAQVMFRHEFFIR